MHIYVYVYIRIYIVVCIESSALNNSESGRVPLAFNMELSDVSYTKKKYVYTSNSKSTYILIDTCTVRVTACGSRWREPVIYRVEWRWELMIGSRQWLVEAVARKVS